jgi:uncharacterized protein (DUF58 family)
MVAAVGAPVGLITAAVAPGRWAMALAWPLAVILLCLFDAVKSLGSARGSAEFPARASVGETHEALVSVVIGGRRPAVAEVAIETPALVSIEEDGRFEIGLDDGRGAAMLPITMLRRGMARFEQMWVRWKGPLGLMWRQARIELAAAVPILPDIRPVHQRGAQIFQRHALQGLIAQLERGEGTDFDALVEYRPGMDRRSIDWKQSARHAKLLAKQYRTERNNQIVFAVDSGRQMSDPVAGLPRVDRAVSAMLLTAWVALRMGDRVALHAFDSRPRLASGFVSGSGAFAELERVAAEIDYSGEETNYTFALTTLAARLTRRSMIVLCTEFTDSVSADFLVRAARRLVETHLLLIVVLRDEELEEIAEREPREADDIARAVTAGALLKDRRVVIGSLQHLGVHVIESEHDKVGERLVAGYLDLKRRNLL